MKKYDASDPREEARRLRSLLNASPAVVYRARPHPGFERTYVSDNVERLLGYTAAEVLGETNFWMDRIHVEDWRACLAALSEVVECGHGVCEYRVRHRNGRYVWVRDEALLSRDSHGLPLEMTGSLIDISAAKFAELHLRAGEARYRAVVEDQSDLVCRFLPDGTITFVNGSYSRFRGLPAERLVGSSFPADMPERNRPELFAMLSSLSPESPVGQFECRAEDARKTWHWLSWTHHALFDERGDLVEYQSVGRDITERKAAEELLARSNAELQQFAYIASHDLQEPLRNATGFLQLLEERYADRLDAEAEEFIRFALDGMDHMRRLISDLLEYSRVRRDLAEFEEVDLRALALDALRTLEGAVRAADAYVEVLDLPTVRGDAMLLGRLFQNLIGNAVKFRSPDRSPHVVVRGERHADTVTISVADNGVGFEPQFAERVFTMFARLHSRSRYEGSGIGLAVCKKIAEIHGGTIRAESEPDVGSTFYVSLPVDRDVS